MIYWINSNTSKVFLSIQWAWGNPYSKIPIEMTNPLIK
jgi:hypothetical protein